MGRHWLDQLWNARYIELTTGERRRNGCFGIRKGYTDVCGFQCTTVISSVPTEPTTIIQGLKSFDKFMLLIRRHSGEYVSSNKHLQQCQREKGTNELEKTANLAWMLTLFKTTSLPKSTTHLKTSPLTASVYLLILHAIAGTERSTFVEVNDG